MTSVYEQGRIPEITPAHRMRIAREFAGLDQGELATRIGISRTSISNAESGRNRPRKVVINAWALATGVPVSWLETGEEILRNPDGGPSSGADLVSERSSVQS